MKVLDAWGNNVDCDATKAMADLSRLDDWAFSDCPVDELDEHHKLLHYMQGVVLGEIISRLRKDVDA